MLCCVTLWSKNASFVSYQVAPCVLMCDIKLAIGDKAVHMITVREF